jgi:UTP--glucose-1-phosphate uridylyltransferase
MNLKIKKAVIPVAGLGTRMLPATKAIPKELLPIYDRPLIQHVVEEAIEAGISEIILVTRSGKEAIENHFDANYELEHRLELSGKKKILRSIKNVLPKNIKISSIRQDNALGLGHAILCAKHLILDDDFAVLLPDEIIEDGSQFRSMTEEWKKTKKGQILVERVPKKLVSSYGVVDIGKRRIKSGKSVSINSLVEKPSVETAPSNLRIVGRYILPSSIFSILENSKPGKDGEIQLTDSLQKEIIQNPQSLNAILCESQIFDCGSKKGFIGANIALAKQNSTMIGFMKEILSK